MYVVARLVLAALLAVPVAAGAAEEILYGLAAMEQVHLLPLLPPNGTQTKQFASYDTSGGNFDGGLDRFRRYDDDGEYVFFDEIGPGCLYRQQMNIFSLPAFFPSEDVNIRMYFDDETTPRLDMSFAEFFGLGGEYTAPFTPPFSFYAAGIRFIPDPFANSYYPFPFAKRLKITAALPPGFSYEGDYLWYQYTYQKFPAGTPVESWAGRATDSAAVRDSLNRVGEASPRASTNDTSGKISVPRGRRARLVNLRGAGSINGLKLAMRPWTRDTFYNVHIRIAWDGRSPAVDMPIGSFFGGGGDAIGSGEVSTSKLATALFGFDGERREFYSHWPMPHWSSARIEIINDAATDVAIRFDVAHDEGAAPGCTAETCGYFAARRTIDTSSEPYARAFSERGRGKVVGRMTYSYRFAMDGDEFTYIDESRTPQIHGNGTEDDHNQGWGGYAFQKPYWGGLVDGIHGAYRLYLNDSYVFNSSIDMFYEISATQGTERHARTESIVWYYLANPGFANLELTDELDVGNAVSELAHAYAISGETGSTTTASSYDKLEMGDPHPASDDGRLFTGSSTFTVQIDPDNEGVKLRRRTNRNVSNVQRANVYVDDVMIADSPWYLCDLPALADVAFADTDFEIPASYTKGKDRITVRVEHVAGQSADSTNEYYYWVYSYAPRSLPEQPPAAPALFAKRAPSGRRVELAWSVALGDAEKLVLQRRNRKRGRFEKVRSFKGSVSGYVDRTASPVKNRAYRMQAVNRTGASPWSAPIVVALPED